MSIQMKVKNDLFYYNQLRIHELKTEIKTWCEENIKNEWSYEVPPQLTPQDIINMIRTRQSGMKDVIIEGGCFYFKNEQDAAIFKLKWL